MSRSGVLRKAIIVVLTLGAIGILGVRTRHWCKTPAWRSSPGGFQLVLTPRLWVWLMPFHENLLVYVLKSKEEPSPGAYPRLWTRRVSYLSWLEFVCYGGTTDIVSPCRGLHWWVFDFDFADTTLHPDPSWGVPYHPRPVRVPGRAIRAHHIGIPLWLLFILFCAYPMIAFVRGPARRWTRRRRGLCVRCGYNLTGNVSGVCPECGRAIEGKWSGAS